ncbi:MAG TPA: hypothetical protein VGA84_17305 [Thermoanaerobaculia bacterium]
MRCVALLLVGCLLSSCATITRGRDEVVAVDSNPSGANATIRCAGHVSASGTTPARLTIPRKAVGCHVSVEKSGMKTKDIEIERGFNASYWLNFIPTIGFPIAALGELFGKNGNGSNSAAWLAVGFSGPAGLIVDRLTGAMYDHNPHVVNVTLQPEQ